METKAYKRHQLKTTQNKYNSIHLNGKRPVFLSFGNRFSTFEQVFDRVLNRKKTFRQSFEQVYNKSIILQQLFHL